MYRRIEFIHHEPDKEKAGGYWFDDGEYWPGSYKTGIMGLSPEKVVDAWFYHLRGPKRSLPPNCKFYFTEKGWREVGRNVVKAAIKTNQE